MCALVPGFSEKGIMLFKQSAYDRHFMITEIV
ncbi:unknown [Clostridium sp. CAG:75]|nr:unknown [Clostridium sp. CAG:75]